MAAQRRSAAVSSSYQAGRSRLSAAMTWQRWAGDGLPGGQRVAERRHKER